MADHSLGSVLHKVRRLATVQTSRGLEDRELLGQFVLDRDEAAFTVLVERHGPMVFGLCRRALGNVHDAEDACQAVFLVLARHATSVRKAASLCSWLHGVACRVAANVKRGRSRRQRRERGAVPAVPHDPAAEVSWREVQAALDEEMGRLPARLRAVLVLCYLDGRTRDEAARLLGVSAGCLHGRLERGRRLLCERLTRRGLSLSAALAAAAVGEGVTQAALPPALVLSSTRAAVQFVDGGAVSSCALSLAREALKGMLLAKLKTAALAALCVGLLLAAAGGPLALSGAPPQPQPGKEAPAASAAGRAGDTARKEATELEGEWEVVAGERDGEFQNPALEDLHLIFRGDEVVVRADGDDGKVMKWKFKLDSRQSPRAIDVTMARDKGKDQAVPGIYALEGDRLRLCLPEITPDRRRRPVAFKTKRGDGLSVLVLERVRPGRPARRPSGPYEELVAVLREWNRAEQAYWNALAQAKTADAKKEARAAKEPQPAPFGQRCLKVAEKYPDTPAALHALFWAASYAPQTDAGKKARDILKGGPIARADLADLARALDWAEGHSRYAEEPADLAPVVLDRVKKDPDHPKAARLLTWVCLASRADAPEAPRPFAEAADLIAGRFADSPDIANFCECIGSVTSCPPWAGDFEKHLRTILKANHHRYVQVCARFALARLVQAAGEARQQEADKLYRQFVKEYEGQDPKELGFLPTLLHKAHAEIDEIRDRGPGKPAPEIEGEDLDGRPMKLSESRGKVVLVSFWATWCRPCMELVPHERALVKRFEGRPFALVGVNGDGPGAVKKAFKDNPPPWRSFRDKPPGKPSISQAWKLQGWPTLYLIDARGIIRQRWLGSPGAEVLEREIDKLTRSSQ
jgi:RNA polymerase sigma factor (sigma-70 family)